MSFFISPAVSLAQFNAGIAPLSTTAQQATNTSTITAAIAVNTALPGLTVKAWCLYKPSDGSIYSSSGVSSLSGVGVGDFTVNFSPAMANVNYQCVVPSPIGVGGSAATWGHLETSKTVNSFRMQTFQGITQSNYPDPAYFAIYG